MSFIVNPSSVSQIQIKNDLINFLNAQGDALVWKDFFASSTGNIVIDLISGLGALLNYNVIAARREAFLPYAQNRSSAIAASSSLGYSTFRGRNQIIDITFTPNTTGTLSKWTVLGTVKDQNIILLNATNVVSGTPVTARCIVGTINTQSLTVTSTGPSLFRYTQPNVSADIRLFLNSTEVALSEKTLDLINGKFVAITNVYDSVDVSYLNLDTAPVQYIVNDVLQLRWIALTTSTFSFTAEDIAFTSGTFTSFSTFALYQAPELIDSIKINAPLANETQFVIRGRKDYLKTFRLSDSSIIDTSGEDVSAAVVRLYYIRTLLNLFTSTEKDALLELISSYRPFGVQPPLITDPDINFLKLAISVTLNPDVGTVSPSTDVSTILDSYRKKLGSSIIFADLERLINNLSYIKITRIKFNPSTWVGSTTYRRGVHVKPTSPGSKIFEMKRHLYRSASLEPTWPTVGGPNYDANLGELVTDGRIVWECVLKPCESVGVWTSNKIYNIDELVIPTGTISDLSLVNKAFKVVDFINLSGSDVNCLTASITYGGTTFTAVNCGLVGNSITLNFDGTKTVATVVSDWNTANPSNTVSFSPGGNASNVLAAATKQLTGGLGTKATTTYGGVVFTAVNNGVEGNLIKLVFDGSKTVTLVVNQWNSAEPNNQVTTSGPGSSVLAAGTATLSGGTAAFNGEPAWPGGLC